MTQDNDWLNNDEFDEPPLISMLEGNQETQAMEEAVMLYSPEAEEESLVDSEIMSVKQANEQKLLSIDGVVAVAIERNAIGDDEIVVYLSNPTAQKHIPKQLEGFSLRIEITGGFDAY
ncbi:hypothetical protein [Crocosphaera sp.]|uniref:hypothetical protein n=1 Tax=Crocosphaera sp. TaxID=2729996 RepID=UPI003F260617|nr:hypothetical protein [Crocosphaera sp.]